MNHYQTKTQNIKIADCLLKITSLKDKNQFYDPERAAESLGISSAMWPISGLVWPSSVVLAKIIDEVDFENKRILEVGCGIGVASIFAALKKADITASDYHPLVNTFLNNNAEINGLDSIKYFHGDWRLPISDVGNFDMVIGSDLLYESHHSDLLASFIHGHLTQDGTVILVDPGRKTAKKIVKSMASLGFDYTVEIINRHGNHQKDGVFRKYSFVRASG